MKANIKMALQSITTNKMRSILTMTGIIFGIGAVIVIFSIINGNTENMKRQIIGGATNSMKIEYGARSTFLDGNTKGDKEKKPDYTPKVTKKYLKQLEMIPNVVNASVFYQEHLYLFVKDKQFDSDVLAVDDHYFDILPYKLDQGRLFLANEYEMMSQVCLVSTNFARSELKTENPINQFIEISGVAFKIIGVVTSETEEKSEKKVFIPSETALIVQQKYNQKPTVLLQANTSEELEVAAKLASIKLTELVPPSNYIFSIKNSDDIRRTTKEINQSNMVLLGGIASISLLVGGIGVMNTMLVSVTERTREIGLKKALGAKQKIILQQFLTEAIVLTVLGGLIGIVLGLIISKISTYYLGYPFLISYFSIGISAAFSLSVGIIFGFAPAYRASKMSPIDALRYE